MHTPGAQVDTAMQVAIISICRYSLFGIYMHMPCAQGLKSMHPAAKISTQGAG